MNIRSNAFITEAVCLLEKVEGSEEETAGIKNCIRQLNAIATLSVIRQSVSDD